MKKVVVVTGASSGIGLELVKLYIKNGFITYGIGQRELDEKGLNYKKCDITRAEECVRTINEIVAEAGKIDILINNAGIGISGPVEYAKKEDVQKIFDVNFFGVNNMIKAALPHMRKKQSGLIINTSSVASFVPIPFQSFYSATKAALDIFSRGLRMEVKDFNIKVICVHPGDVSTGFTDRRKKQDIEKDNPYAKNCNNSISQMEKDEKGGMKASYVATKIYKTSLKTCPKLKQVIGGKYKFFAFVLALLPARVQEWAVRKMYFKK